MKKFYSLFAAVILAATVNAQEVFYSENMGTPTATTPIATNVFQVGAPVTYSGTAEVRNTSPSTGYSGASGAGTVFLNGVNKDFLISGIDTTNYTNITMSFGHNKATNASSNEMTVEVSADGSTWTMLNYTRPTGSGSNGWLLIAPTGIIPTTQNLRIRFNSTISNAQFRLDDVVLSGTNTTLASGNVNVKKASLVKNTVVGNSIMFNSKADIKILNMNGQVVKTASVNENTSLEVSSLAKGMYVVTANVNGKAVSQKIIKK